MADEFNNSVVDVGKLAKPIETLIKKISKGVGGIFEPYQIRRVAKAEAEASIVRAHADVEVSGIQRRAIHRFVEEEAKHQENMESIIAKAIPLLAEGADADRVDDDWIANFFGKSRIVSNGEMQELWARVLSGEANRPGAFSKRTVNLLADLDMSDALAFGALCNFIWCIHGQSYSLVFDTENSIYRNAGLTDELLAHLESIGLVQFELLIDLSATGLPKYVETYYRDYRVPLIFPEENNNTLTTGNVHLTRSGLELANICQTVSIVGLVEYVEHHWRNQDQRLFVSGKSRLSLEIGTGS